MVNITGNKLLRLNKMDGTFNYKKPCRQLSAKESVTIIKFCKKWWREGYEFVNLENKNVKSPPYFEKQEYYKYLTENEIANEISKLITMTKQTLTFMNKKEFEKQYKMMTKNIGEYFLPYVWITISPRKHEKKIDNFRIAILLDKIMREYFYQCYRKTDIVHWCIEFGSEGNHAHSHILCRPIEAHQKSFVKNFSRDFTTLWKKCNDYNSQYVDIIDLKSVAFKLNTLRRPEFINDKLKYMKNETKDAIHENPFDEEMFAKLKVKKYENC